MVIAKNNIFSEKYPADFRPSAIKCLISTGLGRLHLVQSAEHLSRAGVDVEVVQGWVPRLLHDAVINALGRLVNSRHLAVGMKKRRLPFLGRDKVHSCAFSEFFTQGLFLLNSAGLLKRGKAARLGWAAFGRSSSRFLADQNIFHVRSGAGRGAAIKMAKKKGIKVIVDHSIAHPAFMKQALEKEYRRFDMPFSMGPEDPFWNSILEDCRDGDLLLVNSEFVKETFVEQGYFADNIVVAYLGVREDFFNLKESYEIGKQLNLLFTGGFGIRKGSQYLLPALEQLAKDSMDFRLSVIGSYDEAKPLIARSTLGKRLDCMGFIPQDDLKSHLANADIYVFPSLSEGCASSGIEAMAAGLPVIATRESGLPIRHGENGWLISSKSQQAISEAITYLAANDALREHLGRNAAKTIAKNYTWSHYARKVRDIYLTALHEEKK